MTPKTLALDDLILSATPAEVAAHDQIDAFLNRIFPDRRISRILLVNPPDADASLFRYETANADVTRITRRTVWRSSLNTCARWASKFGSSI